MAGADSWPGLAYYRSLLLQADDIASGQPGVRSQQRAHAAQQGKAEQLPQATVDSSSALLLTPVGEHAQLQTSPACGGVVPASAGVHAHASKLAHASWRDRAPRQRLLCSARVTWGLKQQQSDAKAPLQAPLHAAHDKRERSAALLHRLAMEPGALGKPRDASAGDGCARWSWLAADRRDAEGRRPGDPGYDPSTLLVPDAALDAMSNFTRQFWSLKCRAMDVVLFVRHGSFYNLFDVDADVGLRVGLNLSGPLLPNMWKVGCTKDAFSRWASKVLALGYSVGRVEEETPMPQGAPGGCRSGRLLQRRLVRIYSPGTAVDGLLADDTDHRCRPLLALAHLADGSLGLAVVDVARARCMLGVLPPTALPGALAAALLLHDPVECVAVRGNMPAHALAAMARHCTAVHGSSAGALGLSCAGHQALTPGLTLLPRSCGGQLLAEPPATLRGALAPDVLHAVLSAAAQVAAPLAAKGNNEGGSTAGGRRPAAGGSAAGAAVAAAALAVRQLVRCGLAGSVLPGLDVSSLADAACMLEPGVPMLLDDRALLTLDLLASSSSCGDGSGCGGGAAAHRSSEREPPSSLLALLDCAVSPAARRMLREWICRPLTQVSAIQERQDVLGVLLAQEGSTDLLQGHLALLPDGERLLPRAAAMLHACRHVLQAGQDEGEGACAADASPCLAGTPGWRALLALPVYLLGAIEAVALLRKHLQQRGVDSRQLPLLHRAVLAAARAVPAARWLERLVTGAEWRPGDSGVGSPSVAGAAERLELWLAPGADGLHDAALQREGRAAAEHAAALAAALALYRRSVPAMHSQTRARVVGAQPHAQEPGQLLLQLQVPGMPPGSQGAWAANALHEGHRLMSVAAGPANAGAELAVGASACGGSGAGPTVVGIAVLVPELLRAAGELRAARTARAGEAIAALCRAGDALKAAAPQLRALLTAVTSLDVLAGFARALARPGAAPPGCAYSCPRFAAAGAAACSAAPGSTTTCRPAPLLRLHGLWHPLLPRRGPVTPNDLQLGAELPGAMLLTGANMGGKSTLMRAACVAVVMAQLGCYVPAAGAVLEPVDAIWTRMGAADAIMAGRSTFEVELAETSAALAASTRASLLVLDELGRGTSTHDGYAIAFAVLRHLALPREGSDGPPRLLFATHHHGLAREPELAGALQARHLATLALPDGSLRHTHVLADGVSPAGSCGVEVAALAGLPSAVLRRAAHVAAAAARREACA